MPDSNHSTLTPAEVQALKQDLLSSLHCAMPGIVESFDSETQTVSVRPAYRAKRKDGSDVVMPLIRDVPVFFPGSRASALTFPIYPGDECLLIFADACIDGWFETGTATRLPSGRQHDWSDAFAFVGFRSKPNALQSFPSQPSFFGGA